MGEIPEWYYVIRAARYLGVPPWELMEQPKYWLDWALESESAENEAQGIRARHRK